MQRNGLGKKIPTCSNSALILSSCTYYYQEENIGKKTFMYFSFNKVFETYLFSIDQIELTKKFEKSKYTKRAVIFKINQIN